MYHPTTRVLTVLELLQSHQRFSGPELAKRLEVNVRTVRHYIMMLQDMGIPIESERGRYGAYRLRPGFKLPPLMFTEDEALALTLGLLTARRLGLTVAAPAVEGTLAKVERVLPTALRERVQAVQETLVIDVHTSFAAPASEVLGTLCMAAQQSRQVKLHYRSWRSEETERVVDPYGLVYLGGRWFAVGYCHLRAGLRTFRLDRVLQAEMRSDRFVRPPGFDSLEYVTHALANVPGTWFVVVLLETTLEDARSMVPRALAFLEQVNGGVMLRCYFENLRWMARHLVGLGCPFVVYQPPELREALLQLAEEIKEMAARKANFAGKHAR
jgi:predicted DNA-binding transcriptional regulator YafY